MFNESDDNFESLDVSSEEKEQARAFEIQEMRGRYSSSVMSKILESSYAKVPGLSHNVFFTKQAFIFSPSTDNAAYGLPLVEELIRAIEGQDISCDILLFPIVEQQPSINIPFFRKFSSPRNHWVTLHYNTKTQIATVIDSRPFLNSFMYSYDELKESIEMGLANLQLLIKEFHVIHQELQFDDIFCGAWTAINIESLAYGATIPSLTSSFTRESIDSIVQHHIDKVFHDKKGGLRKDLINIDFINEHKIMSPEIQPIIKLLLSHTDVASIVKLINHRENIVFNEKPLSISNPLLPDNLKDVINDLRKKYHGLSATQIASFSPSKQGYSIKDPARLLNNLINIGLNEKEINAFSLIEILFYDAVIFYATSEMETKIQMQIHGMMSIFHEVNELTFFAGSEYLIQQNYEVRNKALPIFKKEILEHHRHQMYSRMMQRLSVKFFMPLKVNGLFSQEFQKPTKLDPLVVLRSNTSSILGNSLLMSEQFTDLIFTNHVNGSPQLIKLNYQSLLQNPLRISQCLIDMRKRFGWDLSKMKMTPYVENRVGRVTNETTHYLSDVTEVLKESVPEMLIESVPEMLIESVPEMLIESVPEMLIESVPEMLIESVPEDLNKYQAESPEGAHGCFDYLWAIIVYMYQLFIQAFEMMSAYILKGNDSAFQKK